MNISKTLEVANKLGIKIIFDENWKKAGSWKEGNEIIINPLRATNYTILHEIGHTIAGYMCCREHCEFTAHGAALALAKIYDIQLSKREIALIRVYARRSLDCPAINLLESKN